MSTIINLRGQLETAESIHVALTHRVNEARRILAIAEADEQEARVMVSEVKQSLRDAEDYERTCADARLRREHMAAPATPLCRLCGQRIHAGGVRCSATCPADERFGRGGVRP